MKILATFPPNYSEINRVFKVRGKPVLFCFGDVIHNPSRINVPPQLLVHEAVHSRRQGSGPEFWWRRYIDDLQFRLDEEIAAHQAEYACLVERGMPQAQACDMVASRLASPLYGGMIDYARARTIIASAECPSTSEATAI